MSGLIEPRARRQGTWPPGGALGPGVSDFPAMGRATRAGEGPVFENGRASRATRDRAEGVGLGHPPTGGRDDAMGLRIERLTRRLAAALAVEQRRRRQLAAARERVIRIERKLAALVPTELPGSDDGAAIPGDAGGDGEDEMSFLRLVAREAAAAIRDSRAGDHLPTTRVGARRAAHARTMERDAAARRGSP
jgi:hypothetical protein